MSLTSASYPASHSRMQYHSYHHPDISPTMSHEPLPAHHSTSPISPPIEPSHPSSHYHHQHQHQDYQEYPHKQEYQHQPYHHAYQAPSPPYSSSTSHPHRSNSSELAQKSSLPYPASSSSSSSSSSRHPSHTYSSPSHRAHPYSPPTLPPLTGRPPLSPQSPVESSHYPIPGSSHSHAEERHHYRASSMSASPPPSSQAPGGANAALSANDRRERNKAASAKYRAKKHYQSGEMRSQITTLQDQNNVLSRQLDECRAENASLKNLVEKLKGRLVAEKVLKRLREVGREKSKRRGSQSSTAAGKISADDLALLSDSETEDMVDAVEDEVVRVATVDLEEDFDQVIDEEEEEVEEVKIKASLRSMDKKLGGTGAGAKRRGVRTNMDDEEYRDA